MAVTPANLIYEDSIDTLYAATNEGVKPIGGGSGGIPEAPINGNRFTRSLTTWVPDNEIDRASGNTLIVSCSEMNYGTKYFIWDSNTQGSKSLGVSMPSTVEVGAPQAWRFEIIIAGPNAIDDLTIGGSFGSYGGQVTVTIDGERMPAPGTLPGSALRFHQRIRNTDLSGGTGSPNPLYVFPYLYSKITVSALRDSSGDMYVGIKAPEDFYVVPTFTQDTVDVDWGQVEILYKNKTLELLGPMGFPTGPNLPVGQTVIANIDPDSSFSNLSYQFGSPQFSGDFRVPVYVTDGSSGVHEARLLCQNSQLIIETDTIINDANGIQFFHRLPCTMYTPV